MTFSEIFDIGYLWGDSEYSAFWKWHKPAINGLKMLKAGSAIVLAKKISCIYSLLVRL
jgi:hypothetical protein